MSTTLARRHSLKALAARRGARLFILQQRLPNAEAIQ